MLERRSPAKSFLWQRQDERRSITVRPSRKHRLAQIDDSVYGADVALARAHWNKTRRRLSATRISNKRSERCKRTRLERRRACPRSDRAQATDSFKAAYDSAKRMSMLHRRRLLKRSDDRESEATLNKAQRNLDSAQSMPVKGSSSMSRQHRSNRGGEFNDRSFLSRKI